jgi:hypothetical protein
MNPIVSPAQKVFSSLSIDPSHFDVNDLVDTYHVVAVTPEPTDVRSGLQVSMELAGDIFNGRSVGTLQVDVDGTHTGTHRKGDDRPELRHHAGSFMNDWMTCSSKLESGFSNGAPA